MNTAARIVADLEALGVEYVFGYPGGRVIEVFEALADSPITVVRPRDEREASVMAEAYGRFTRSPGVLAGQGPWIGSLGALGQMEARLGSSPMVILTEASERGEYSTLAPYQQSRGDYGGLDLPAILGAITEEHWFPRTPLETVRTTQLAFKHAVASRTGPTAVILDGNAVSGEVPEEPTPPLWDPVDQTRTWQARPTDRDVSAAAEALAESERPVVVAGNGIHAANAYDALESVAETYDAAVVTSYLGKSSIPEIHPRAGGVIGAFGHQGANDLVSDADVLLVVGCRLNPMDSNWNSPGFVRPDEQTILHADIDPRNAGWVYPADVGLIGDAGESLRALCDIAEAVGGIDAGGGAGSGSETDGAGADATDEDDSWALASAAEAREDFSVPECDSDATPIKPQRVVKEVSAVVDEGAIVTADSGNNRFWLLNYLQAPATGTYFGSGGVGAMGWAAPAAVTAALLGREAIAVCGDGGFAMTMTAIETALDHGVAPTYVVMNDHSLGMVRQMDDGIPGAEFRDTDFVTVTEGLGGDGLRITDPADLAPGLDEARSSDVPFVLGVRIDRNEEMAASLQSSYYADVGGLHE
ncbi:acetolactate synthase [Halobacteriales archaeon QS_8_65_32]|nr:MAG: acetolactate synthase [Halobacteriales archaeon QS_8_65_32]